MAARVWTESQKRTQREKIRAAWADPVRAAAMREKVAAGQHRRWANHRAVSASASAPALNGHASLLPAPVSAVRLASGGYKVIDPRCLGGAQQVEKLLNDRYRDGWRVVPVALPNEWILLERRW